jgi:quercetin dioxygenase-like cupin family protein
MELNLQQHIRFHEDYPVSEILHSCQDMRVILINLLPGQVLPAHASSSTVSLQVVAGRGELLSGCDWAPAQAGTLRFYPPGEPHGIKAGEERLTVLAILAPRP